MKKLFLACCFLWPLYFSAQSLVMFERTEIDLGKINFDEDASAIIRFYYNKQADRYSIIYGRTPNSDSVNCVFSVNKDHFTPFKQYGGYYPYAPYYNEYPSYGRMNRDTAYLKISIRNLEGNTGLFLRKLDFTARQELQASILVKGEFVDKEKKRAFSRKLFSGTADAFYTKGYPDSIRFYTAKGKLYRIRHYINHKQFRDSVLFISGPKIEFVSRQYSYGNIEKGGNGKCAFKFTNTGDEPLIISNSSTSCGCLVSSHPKEPIPPGGSAEVKLHYDTQRIGAFTKTATVTSNATNTPVITLKIKGVVHEALTTVWLQQEEIDLGEIEFGKEKKAEIKFCNMGANKLQSGSSYSDYYNCALSSSIRLYPLDADHPGRSVYEGDSGIFIIHVSNVYGNTGNFVYKVALGINTRETRYVTVRGKFVGLPAQDTLVKTDYGYRYFYYYKDNKLHKVSKYFQDELSCEDVYVFRADMTMTRMYHYNNNMSSESTYVNGELIKDQYFSR